MAEVARANGVPFVDLFTPSLELYRKAGKPLTINGVHLNESGDQQLALVIDKALFGEPSPKVRDFAQLEKLRRAVLDKNFTWFERYRTTDGYSIFGGRADLKFVNDQTNRVVMQREMEVLDVMTANRDRRIWALAEGSELQVDDSNTPPFIDVITNKPGPLPGGKHVFLGGEEEIGKMTVAKGMKVNLFASEEMFPELVDPVQMAFDTKGRLWVAAWGSYPHWKPKDEMNDKLLILEDTDGDGKADKCITFADHLHNPTGFEFWGDGVLVAHGARLVVPQGHRRRRQSRFSRARAERARLGRHASHVQQLHARPGRGPLFSGGHVPPLAGRDALRSARAAGQRGRVSLRAPCRRNSTSMSRTALPIRTGMRSMTGARTSWSMARGPTRTTRPCFQATSTFPTSTRLRRWFTSRGRGPVRASSIFRAAIFPTRCRATCWSAT